MASSARIDDLRKKFEENPRRYFAPLANEYRKAGEIEQAIAICREYLPQQPGHMSGHIVFGQALYEARQFDESKAVFETALTLDPENLIALRHLGDIALMLGDNDGARGWYRRVLDADPRNEEIQSQLALLDRSGAPSRTPEPPTVPAPRVEPPTVPAATPISTTVVEQHAVTRPPPSPSAPTVVISAVKPPAKKADEPIDRPLETVTPESPTKELSLDAIAPAATPATKEVPADTGGLDFEPTSMSGADAQRGAPTPSLGVESHMAAPADAPPLDSFSLDGLETTSMAPPPAPAAPPAEPAPPAIELDLPPTPSVPVADVPPAAEPIDLDFTPTSAPEPPAAAAPEPAPIDLDFGTPAPTPAVPAPAPPAPASIDLDFGPPAPAPAEPPETTADLPMLDVELPSVTPPPAVAAMPAPEPAPRPEPQPAAATPVPFMTETMAELYLQQGHRDKAFEVYQALLSQRPGDAALRARVDSLRQEAAPPPPPAHGGPTIRDVLNVIALRRPGHRPTPVGTNGTTPVVADAFSLLFGGAQPGNADELAAIALATAFASNGDTPGAAEAAPISGEPARVASSELSLGSVFGESGAAEPAPSNFALNQYFSAKATGEHATQSSGRGEGREESPEEVAKFTQWLEGLKRR